jgi:hypothetical protein
MGIFCQGVGPSLANWAKPVQFSFDSVWANISGILATLQGGCHMSRESVREETRIEESVVMGKGGILTFCWKGGQRRHVQGAASV